MSARAELVAELHALAAFLSTCEQSENRGPWIVESTVRLARGRMLAIAGVLTRDEPELEQARTIGQMFIDRQNERARAAAAGIAADLPRCSFLRDGKTELCTRVMGHRGEHMPPLAIKTEPPHR